MEAMDPSSAEDVRTSVGSDTTESLTDINTVLKDFPLGDDFPGQRIPIMNLDSAAFEDLAPIEASSMLVFLRVRPIGESQEAGTDMPSSSSSIQISSSTSIKTIAPDCSKRSVSTKIDERHYTFSRVFGPLTSQAEVFDTVGRPLLERFLAGSAACVLFAYGMTNAGKTHTIQGQGSDPGLFPRLLSSLLEHKQSSSSLQLSMLEIYQDKIFDLLSFRRENLHIRDNGGGAVEVAKLTQHAIGSMDDANRLIESAGVRRSKASTSLNSTSSRSHAVYTMTLVSEVPTESRSFYVIDLAGAERGSRTRANIHQQREANNINTSLMQLWRCLNAMKRKPVDGAVVPFRESKLTHILMPALGCAKLAGTAMLTCVNPQVEDYDETISVLGNASLACSIKEIVDVRAAMLVNALAMERAMDRASNKEAKAAVVESRKRRADGLGGAAAPAAKLSREAATRGAKRGSDATVLTAAMTSGNTFADAGDETAIMKQELARLTAENRALQVNQMQREREIRIEVSNELELRSTHLLEQVQDLYDQLSAIRAETGKGNDLNKSVVKARGQQRALILRGDSQNTQDAEEELEQLKVLLLLDATRIIDYLMPCFSGGSRARANPSTTGEG